MVLIDGRFAFPFLVGALELWASSCPCGGGLGFFPAFVLFLFDVAVWVWATATRQTRVMSAAADYGFAIFTMGVLSRGAILITKMTRRSPASRAVAAVAPPQGPDPERLDAKYPVHMHGRRVVAVDGLPNLAEAKQILGMLCCNVALVLDKTSPTD
jgi:hypothetical protein